MKWRGRRGSDNIVDQRGSRSGGFRLPRRRRAPRMPRIGRRGGRRGGLGLGMIAVILVGAWLLGVPIGPLLGMLLGGGGLGGGSFGGAPLETARSGPNTIDDDTEAFVSVVLADTEEVWTREFEKRGARYEAPKLVLFSDAVRSACGRASSAVGPFYCPGDRRIYLDTGFFDTLAQELGAGGDFARAYVIAHEAAHHVQNLSGVMEETARVRATASEAQANAISVRVELQADCLSGVWAHHVEARFDALEPGDIEEALNAAARIGDDALQRRSQGHVVPDSFTHGTSEQRVRWFRTGYESGAMERCDTFGAERL